MSNHRTIYLDYAAATPLSEAVQSAMQPWLEDGQLTGNPSSAHSRGHVARQAIDGARSHIAQLFECPAHDIFFTAGGTISCNLAVLGIMRAIGEGTVLTSAIEHSAVLEPARALAADPSKKFQHGIIPVNQHGVVTVQAVVDAITPDTKLISIMLANNEISTLQPLPEIITAVKAIRPDILIHTDACQAAAWLPVPRTILDVDALSFSANKLYGPTGSGALVIRSGIPLQPLWYGGEQERSMHPGTESVSGIVGLSAALDECIEQQASETARLTALRDQLEQGVTATISDSHVNGQSVERLPHISNITVPNVDGDALLFALDQAGVTASLGSACAAGSVSPSHVLLALGLPASQAKSSLRFSLGRETTNDDIDRVIEILPGIVKNLQRSYSEV